MSAITRNLYREDEVIAAIRWCIVNDRPSQAVFWVQEGLDSDMDVVVLQTLLEVWLYNVGVSRLSWFFWFLEGLNGTRPFTEENIVALTVALVNSVKGGGDTTVFAILAIGMEEAPPVGRADFEILSSALRSLSLSKNEITLARAVLQGKFVTAWSLAGPLWASGRAQAILEAMESPQFPLETLGSLYSEEFLWPFRALSLVIAHSTGCLHSVPEPYPGSYHLGAVARTKGDAHASAAYIRNSFRLSIFLYEKGSTPNEYHVREGTHASSGEVHGSQYLLEWA